MARRRARWHNTNRQPLKSCGTSEKLKETAMNGQAEKFFEDQPELELPEGQERTPLMLWMAEQPPGATPDKAGGLVPQPTPIIIPPIVFGWGMAGIEATQATQFFLIN